MMNYSRESGTGYHLFYMFDKIMKYGFIPEDVLYEYSKYYDLVDNNSDNIYRKDILLGLKDSKMKCNFCKNIKLKYTDDKIDDAYVLKRAMIVAKSVIDKMREDNQELKMIVENQNINYGYVINSRWWKLRKIILFWKK